MDSAALISTLNTREIVDGGRREEPPPAVRDREVDRFQATPEEPLPSIDREGTASAGRGGGTPCACAAMLATREDIDAALDDQRPPYKPPDLPQCYASDLKVPGSHREAMRSEYAHLWVDSTGREFYGLLDAGTFEPV